MHGMRHHHFVASYAALSLSYWAFAASALATYGALMSSGIARHSSPISLPTAPKAMPGFSLRTSGRRMAAYSRNALSGRFGAFGSFIRFWMVFFGGIVHSLQVLTNHYHSRAVSCCGVLWR